MMKKICMMVTNPCTNDARVLKEARTLSENGYDIIILAINGNNTPKIEYVDDITIKRIKRKFKSNTLLGKIEFILKFTPFATKERAHIYHAHDLSTLLECYIASRINKAKIISDSHEIYIRSYGKKSFGDLLYGTLENLLIRRVDRVITVNELIADELTIRYHLLEKPSTIMNCPSIEALKDNITHIDEKIIKNKRDGKKMLIYQGVIQEGRALRQLIKYMNFLSDDYYLMIIGDGHMKEELMEVSKNLNLNHKIIFTGMVSLEMLPEYTKIADLGIIPAENDCLNNYFMSPNKLFEYLHANIPVLAPNYPFVKEIIEKYSVGILLEIFNHEEISRNIKKIFNNIEKYDAMKNNTELAKNDLNWEIESKKLIEIYKSFNH